MYWNLVIRTKSILEKTSQPFKLIKESWLYGTDYLSGIVMVFNQRKSTHGRQSPVFLVTLFNGGVQGFTDLSQKYNELGLGGASKLSQELNKYIGNMIQEILSHKGDIFKFSGDAFLVLFKVSSVVSIQDAVHEALDTAILIQTNYGSYETEIGVKLRIKVAVSCGKCYHSLIGTQEQSNYMIVGTPIWDVKFAEEISVAGDVIVCTSAWGYVTPNEYIYSILPDHLHYKLFGFSANWRSVQANYEISLSSRSSVGTLLAMDKDYEDGDIDSTYFKTTLNSFSLRPSLNFAVRKKLDTFLKRFMILPLMNAIEIGESLEYLTEIRQIVIVFVNTVIEKSLPKYEILTVVNNVYIALCRIVAFHEGIVNKVSFFDKDLMFLVVFGLRGYKHDNESQRGLRCAAELYKTLSTLQNVNCVSIGVTTGMTYCGIVGHTLRREYSVISVSVNKAARLMTNYPNKVTCSRETYLASKMESKHFVIQKQKKLKGLVDVGAIYEFNEIFPPAIMNIPNQLGNKLIGREVQIKIFNTHIGNALNVYNNINEQNEYEELKTCLIFSGDSKHGKTRLLDEIFTRMHGKKMNCVKFTMFKRQLRKPYSTIGLCISFILGLTPTMKPATKEKLINNKLKNNDLKLFLYLLNPIFSTNFHYNNPNTPLSDVDIFMIRSKILKSILTEKQSKFCIILIDDIEYSDAESFGMFDLLFESLYVFSIFTLGNHKNLVESCHEISEHVRVLKTNLEPIDKIYYKELACQFLKVVAVPLELEQLIHRRSMGNPGWIDNFLVFLTQAEAVDFSAIKISEAIKLNLVFTEQFSFNSDGTLNVATITQKFYKIQDEIDLNIDSSYLIIYDALSSYEQLLCKCASVLGERFLRSMLSFVISSDSENTLSLGIKKLFDLKIITCARGNFSTKNTIYQKTTDAKDSNKISCECRHLHIDSLCYDLPKYASCGFSSFKSIEFKDTMYNLLTDKQRKYYHNRAYLYLDRETRKCDSCGGDFFKSVLINRDYLPRYRFSLEEEALKITLPRQSSTTRLSAIGLKKELNIINFSQFDFRNCECNVILCEMYTQLLLHCNGAGLQEQAIETEVEYASTCIKSSNEAQALELLLSALTNLKSYASTIEDSTLLIPFLYGRIYTLLGICHFYTNETEKSLEYFYSACSVMGFKYPRKRGLNCKNQINNSMKRIKQVLIHGKSLVAVDDDFTTLITEQFSKCFSSMFCVFRHQGFWTLAQLAAHKSLEMSLIYRRNFYSIVMGFSNVLQITYHTGKSEQLHWLQVKSLEVLSSFKEVIDASGIFAISKLYTSILICQIVRVDKKMAIDLGYSILRIAESIRNVTTKLEVIPILVYLLLSHKRISDIATLLGEWKDAFQNNPDKTGMIWYYALCLDVQLDTCYTIVSYGDCESFFREQYEDTLNCKDTFAKHRFFSNLWLFCIRYQAWQPTALWEEHLGRCPTFEYRDPMICTLTALRIFEGLILSWIYFIDKRDKNEASKTEKEIINLGPIIEKSLALSNCLASKYLLLKTYYRLTKHYSPRIIEEFENSNAVRRERKNSLHHDMLTFNLKVWKNNASSEEIYFWRSNCKILNWTAFETNKKIYPFALAIGSVSKKNISSRMSEAGARRPCVIL